ncbi:MAG: hypothetical protein ACI4OZ_08610 [Akkermansia sp.]
MSISENKRVLGISAAFLAAFAGLGYVGFSQHSACEEATKELTDTADNISSMADAEFAPSRNVQKELTAANKTLAAQKDAMKAQFAPYPALCDTKPLSSPEFQAKLRRMNEELTAAAKTANCDIAAPARDLGMSSLLRDTPQADMVPLLTFQLEAIGGLEKHAVDAGAVRLDKVFCAPLPDPKEAAKAAKKLELLGRRYYPVDLELAFTAKHGTVLDALNRIMNDKKVFYIITGLAIKNDTPLQPMDDALGKQQEALPTTQGAEAAGAEAAAPPVPVAKQIAGLDKEEARVHLTVRALYFIPEPAKSTK